MADIFYAVPARRKFLKSETTELGHIASLVTHYALAHPDRQFLLKTPSQEILNCAPVEKLADRVYQIFGRQALEELTEIPATEAPMRTAITEPQIEADEKRATIRVTGFASRPEVQRTNRNGIYIFVNRRLVRDRLLLHAINEAYRNIMPPGVFPVVLLFLEMPIARKSTSTCIRRKSKCASGIRTSYMISPAIHCGTHCRWRVRSPDFRRGAQRRPVQTAQAQKA